MAAFTHQWTNRGRQNMLGDEGRPLALAAGTAFTSRGVAAGDTIYVVAVNAGKLHLVGRMRVAAVCPRRDWDRHPGSDLWPRDEVVVGTDGKPMRFRRNPAR